ncbi:hypothetical protein [Lysobacter panacisoli]|uniref:Uncharacterized protein n=1 Tax=Lysobacter panacisoli TaxID=1255263 RepID=A0ABP9LI37_9GAMM|nr:hypothetical protein [Lysobacter panacisoli]
MCPPDDEDIVTLTPGSPPTANPDPFVVPMRRKFRLESARPFVVQFHDDSPDEDDPQRERRSRPRNGKHVVRMRARRRDGNYGYSIVMDGEGGDPAIIIRRQ